MSSGGQWVTKQYIKIVVALSLYMLCTFSANARDAQEISVELEDRLSSWDIKQTTMIDDDTLLILMNETRITKVIFESVISSGICTAIWLDGEKSVEKITTVVIVNKFSEQGYLFTPIIDACKKIGDLSGKQAEAVLWGHSKII